MFRIIIGSVMCVNGAFKMIDEDGNDISDRLKVQSVKIEASVDNRKTRATIVCDIEGAEINIDPSDVVMVSTKEANGLDASDIEVSDV